MAASSSSDLMQAHVELLNLTFSYLDSMALQCAIELEIPNAIHRHGGGASLPDLLAVIPVPEHRKPYLQRLMSFLVVTGILSLDAPAAGEAMYRLTALSSLLVDDICVNGGTSLAPFALSQTTKYHVTAAMHLFEWFKAEDGVGSVVAGTPFKMVHGTNLWGALFRDPQLNDVFHAGTRSECQLALDFIVINHSEVFDGLSSLIDVGGGDGKAARAIARAFPHVKCSVLDLPNVISGIQPADGMVEYIEGDMMKSIPATDAVMLKYVLHARNDEDCAKILTQCKKAIQNKKPSGGKVIIIDIVVGSPSKDMFESQVSFNLLMMVITACKERDEHEWHNIFMDAGVRHYKMRAVLGFLSILSCIRS